MKALAVLLLSLGGAFAAANDAAESRVSIPHKQVLTEIGGGSDSAVSPDGKYITYSSGPGGRCKINGPGTFLSIAEIIGVRGKWNLFLRKADGKGPIIQLTQDEEASNKESEWIRVVKKEKPKK